MKTKHILAVLSTCLVAVSFSPINFFSQAAPPPGFTMFDGKEFQFDATSVTPDVWHLAFTCPASTNMKITNIISTDFSGGWSQQCSVDIRVTRAANSQIVMGYYGPGLAYKRDVLLSPGDIIEYHVAQNYNTSVSIHGMID
jgi:hypothetical protein